MSDEFIYGVSCGLAAMWLLSILLERAYKKILVMKADPRCRTAEKIGDEFYYIVPAEEYLTLERNWFQVHPYPVFKLPADGQA